MLHHKHSEHHAVGIAHRVRNRIALAVVSLFAAFGFVLVGATTSFAHNNVLTAQSVCTTSGNWAVTWTISNDWGVPATVIATTSGTSPSWTSLTPSTASTTGVTATAAAGNNVTPFGTGSFIETLPGTTTGGITIATSSTWTDGYGPVIDTGNATLVGICPQPTTTTTLSSPPGSVVLSSGLTAHDTATVTGTPGNPPTGTVTFYWCSSTTSSPTTCSATGSNSAGSGSLGTPNTTAGTATATSSNITISAAGFYCFYAVYGGTQVEDSINNSVINSVALPGYLGSSDTSTSTECFQVTTPSTPTPPPPPPSNPKEPTITSAPSAATVTLGGSSTDTVTVTGTNNVVPTGSVNFYECGPGATSCTSATGKQVGSTAVNLSGTGSVATATSASFVPSATGAYCYVAVYSGDTNYAGSPDVNGAAECFTVNAVTTTTAAAPPAAVATPATVAPTSNISTAAKSKSSPTTVAPAVSAAAATPVPNATAVHTGKPWAGSAPLVFLFGGIGILLLGSAEVLRRRSHA